MSLTDLIKEGYWPTDSVPTLPITSGLEFYLDASVKSSVDVPNQLWRNLVASPASGAAQSDYDFQMGDDTTSGGSDEPLHVGTPTGGHGNAYWNMGVGITYFRTPSRTTFTDSMHKAGAAFTFVIVLQALKTDRQRYFNTLGSSPGVSLLVEGGSINMYINGSFIETGPTFNSNKNFLAFAVEEGGGSVSKYRLNDVEHTFSASYGTTGQSVWLPTIGFQGSGSAVQRSYIKATIMYNRRLTSAELDTLYNHFVSRGYL